jgi:hypothetical protein
MVEKAAAIAEQTARQAPYEWADFVAAEAVAEAATAIAESIRALATLSTVPAVEMGDCGCGADHEEGCWNGPDADHPTPAAVDEELVGALRDVAAERARQIDVEGWTPEHDDEHGRGELARAAVCYVAPLIPTGRKVPFDWPWDTGWWKPKNRRHNLVRAAALIVAEIERLDRALAAQGEASRG